MLPRISLSEFHSCSCIHASTSRADRAQMIRAVAEQRRDHLRGVRAGHRGLDDVEAGVDAAGDGERRLDAPGQRRRAAQAQRQLRGIRQRQRANDLELSTSMSMRWKRVKRTSAVGAGRVELLGEVREGGEERRQLDGHRDADGCASPRARSRWPAARRRPRSIVMSLAA